ncbi:MAG: hypothetical protein DCC75_02665, partial [Proteobacteria bacterium]
MPSIVNGLFSGRSGISSHGSAIAVVGDNISNSSTLGFKAGRAEFQDLIAGGQTSGRVIGSGSAISAVNNVFEQGTLEFSGRPLDLAIDGNGFFVLDDDGQRFYSRAGNFKIDSDGFLINQNGLRVLGFPSGGNGSLQGISVNNVSQDSVATTEVAIAGNLDSSADTIASSAIPTVLAAGTVDSDSSDDPTYADLNALAEFSTVVDVFDSLGAKHTVTFFFFHVDTDDDQYIVRGYVNSEEVDPSGSAEGLPRQIGTLTLDFAGDGSMESTTTEFTATVPWTNGSNSSSIDIDFGTFTQFAAASNILAITQDGQGIGTVGNISIEKNGDIFALLDNGQAAIIGTIGMVNFPNPEGLV